VSRCIVGYAGGKEPFPTYQKMKDYTECVLVEYDPARISYEKLLAEFVKMGGGRGSYSRQYRSVVLYADDGQKGKLENFVDARKAKGLGFHALGIEPFTEFYRGEEYHQNYLAKATGGGACGW